MANINKNDIISKYIAINQDTEVSQQPIRMLNKRNKA